MNLNSKIPAEGETIDKLYNFNNIDIKKYNVGIPAGANNLIILDIDKKDAGLIEFYKFQKEYNILLNGLCEKTPNGGLHYYFYYNDDRYTPEQNELISRLKCKNKYRDAGIDIKINNGYCIAAPSSIDNKFYEIINNSAPALMPLELLKWLLEKELKNEYTIKNNVCIINDEIELINILDDFEPCNSLEWLKITTATKNLINQYNNNLNEEEVIKIWDKWSIKYDNYNYVNNIKIWKENKGQLTFNYLYYMKCKTDEEYNIKKLEMVRPYKPVMFNDISNIKTIQYNNKYVYDKNNKDEQLNIKYFNEYNTIILKSNTGTGKTTAIKNLMIETMEAPENKDNKFLSIVHLKTLSQAHAQVFNKINVKNYEDDIDINNDNITICLNSILKYQNFEPHRFNNYIVYIDEITSLLLSLTHNDTLNDKLKFVYIVLMRIVNNCKKLILSDATINDGVFYLLEKRNIKHEPLMVINNFVKFENIKINIMNDELKFIKKIIKDVKTNNPFLYAADSKNIIKQHFNKAAEYSKDKDNLLLITSEDKLKITDANEQFKNKCVFYSPSIVSGVDFNSDKPQNVFQYIKGNTLNPILLYQQLTRTRNIKKVYQFIDTPRNITQKQRNYHSNYPDYKNIEECRQIYEKMSLTYSNTYNNNELYKMKQGKLRQYSPVVLSMFINIIDDEFQFNYNAFFKIFTYNEYIIDTLNTNKKAQLKYILRNNGFIIEDDEGEVINISKEIKQQLKDEADNIKETQLIEHITDIKQNDNIAGIISYLNINNIEDAEEYKEIILNKHIMGSFTNFIKLIKTNKFINDKVNKELLNLPEYKAVQTTNYKIQLLTEFERALNIERFDINYLTTDKEIEIDKDIIFRIEKAFNIKRKKHDKLITYNDHIKFYIQKLLTLTNGLNIINSKREQINKKRIQRYNINGQNLIKHLKLYLLMDNSFLNIQLNNKLIFTNTINEEMNEIKIKYQNKPNMEIDIEFLEDTGNEY
jgi:hypothetical protein